jgi:biopolymer transport protein ExbD
VLRERAGTLGSDTPAEAQIAFADLRDALARRATRHGAASLIVLIDAGDLVPYDEVVQVHEWCAQLGIQRVGLAP